MTLESQHTCNDFVNATHFDLWLHIFFERETCNSLIREKDYNRGQETNRLIPGQIEQDMINRVG